MLNLTLSGISRNGMYVTSCTFGYDELLRRLHARMAQLNHNLAPDPDSAPDSVSWNEELDTALARFSAATAAARVQGRLAAWEACLEINADNLIITLETATGTRKLSTLINNQIDSVLYNSVCADKLSLCAEPLRDAVRLIRDEYRERADRSLEDLACTLAIIDNRDNG